MEVENSSTVRLQILLILSHWKTSEDALSYCANEHAPTRNFTSDRLGFTFFLFCSAMFFSMYSSELNTWKRVMEIFYRTNL